MKLFTSVGLFFFSVMIAAQSPAIIEDTYVQGGSDGDKNYGELTDMMIKSSPTNESFSRRAYLKFDISGVSTDAVLRFDLRLFATYVDGPFEFGVYKVADDWDEHTITWNNAPAMDELITTFEIDKSHEGSYISIDLSSYILQNDPGDYLSLGIMDPYSANHHIRFSTKEAGENIPEIVITEATTVPEAPGDLSVRALTPKQVEFSWTDNSTEESGFLLEQSLDGINFEGLGSIPANVVNFSILEMLPGTTYHLRVRAYNGLGSSEPSEVVTITTPELADNYTYYIDATGGDDGMQGNTFETAWKTLDIVSRVHFLPGSHIYFKRGESWTGSLVLQGSGEPGNPNVIESYGEGDKPLLNGPGTAASNTVFFDNVSHWEIDGIAIRNYEEVEEGDTEVYKRGIYVHAHDMGEVKHLLFRNLEVYDINSTLNEAEASKNWGGIFMEITGDAVPTWFDSVVIENCHFHDVGRTGISNASSWDRRGLNSEFGDEISSGTYDNWVPSKNVVFVNNRIENTGGNGLILRVADKPLVEYNYFYNCATVLSGNAAFCFNTDSAVFQYNEASYTVYNPGDTDARGIDSDFRTKHTIIQYNYLHHNGFGGVVATGGPGGTTSVPRFNDGTIIRYNILADNEHHLIRTSGVLTNLYVYNNVFYSGEQLDNIIVIYNGSWSGAAADGSYYYNNVFHHLGSNPTFDFGSSRNNVLSHNAFFGNRAANEPADENKVTSDPKFVDPGVPEDFGDLQGFMVSDDSPLRGAGLEIAGMPVHDLYGNLINERINIGVHQTLNTAMELFKPEQILRLFPNPAANLLNVMVDQQNGSTFDWEIFTMEGRVVSGGSGPIINNRIDFVLSAKEEGLVSGQYMIRINTDRQQTLSEFFTIK
jgi:hypothetical protein